MTHRNSQQPAQSVPRHSPSRDYTNDVNDFRLISIPPDVLSRRDAECRATVHRFLDKAEKQDHAISIVVVGSMAQLVGMDDGPTTDGRSSHDKDVLLQSIRSTSYALRCEDWSAVSHRGRYALADNETVDGILNRALDRPTFDSLYS